MRRILLLVLIALTALNPLGTALGDVIWENAAGGSWEFSAGTYHCRQQYDGFLLHSDCTPCTAGSPGPVLHVPDWGSFGARSGWGTLTGRVFPEFVIDGVRVSSRLIPAGGRYESVLHHRRAFCPWDYGFGGDCWGGEPCNVLSYNIEGQSGALSGHGEQRMIAVPTGSAQDGVDFSMTFCNGGFIWGAGCNFVGSQGYRWRLIMPAPVAAIQLGGGDAPAWTPGAAGLTIDLASGSGGTLTAMRRDGPSIVCQQEMRSWWYPNEWEIKTSMEPGSFAADLSIAYDPALVHDELERHLVVVRLGEGGTCEALPSTVDLAAGRVTAQGLDRFSVFGLWAPEATPAASTTWGRLKTIYR